MNNSPTKRSITKIWYFWTRFVLFAPYYTFTCSNISIYCTFPRIFEPQTKKVIFFALMEDCLSDFVFISFYLCVCAKKNRCYPIDLCLIQLPKSPFIAITKIANIFFGWGKSFYRFFDLAGSSLYSFYFFYFFCLYLYFKYTNYYAIISFTHIYIQLHWINHIEISIIEKNCK